MRKLLFALLFVLVSLVLVGCSENTNNSKPQAIANLERFKTMTNEYPNMPAPSFELIDDKGDKITDESLKGKIYILQGYTYGCSSCAEEVETLNKVHEKYKDVVEIISMDIVSEDIETALETKRIYNGGNWHWTLDNDNVAVKFEMKSLESTYIVDREGIIRYKDEAVSDANLIFEEIEKII